MFSQHYAEAKGYSSASQFLQSLPSHLSATCTWGEQGAWAKQNDHLFHCPAFKPQTVVDTLGAGDTFNAGLISAFVNKHPLKTALHQASQLAGKKCGQLGFKNLTSHSVQKN
jgi:ketohexokinase